MAAKFYIGGIYQQRGKPFRLLSVHVGERELLYSCRAQRPNSDAADRGAWTYAPYVETPEDRLFTEAELAEAAFADERCVRCRNFFASQLLDRELRADPEFYIHPTLLGRYMNIWVGRCDLRCLTSRLGTLNPFCAYYTDRDPSKPADAASLRAALSRFELCCESDGSGAVRRLRGGSNAVSLLELPALFPERETLASLLPSAACDVYVFHHTGRAVVKMCSYHCSNASSVRAPSAMEGISMNSVAASSILRMARMVLHPLSQRSIFFIRLPP